MKPKKRDEVSEVVSRCFLTDNIMGVQLVQCVKVAAQWPEVDSNLWPSGYNAQNIPLHHTWNFQQPNLSWLTNRRHRQSQPEREWHADWQRNRDGADRGRQKIRIHSTQQNRNPDEFQAKVEMTYYTEWETDRQGERQRKKQTEQLKQLRSFIRISINITWVNKRENSQPGRRTQLYKTSYYILCPSAHLFVCPSTSPFTFLSIQCTSTSVCPSVSVYMPLHLSVSLSFFQYTRDTSPVQI